MRNSIFETRGLTMKQSAILFLLFLPFLAISALLSRAASADEIRHTTFPAALLGTWGETAQQCTDKDKSNIAIEPAQYGDANGSCAVRWIVETAGSHGPNYAVHAQCTSASQPAKAQTVNIIIRPETSGRATMGRSFDSLKSYQRCPEG
jgi:hypothetical protein